jgi:uncharacterized protein
MHPSPTIDTAVAPSECGRQSAPAPRGATAPDLRRCDVTFDSSGVTCRAWLYAPNGGITRPAPCIVMAHGLGGNRECALDPYARRFAAAGFYVLLFDYRNIGASDGTPRQVIEIERQLQDWASAVRFVRGLDGVDPRRIGLWGTSLSGGHVVTAAARDGHIAAISAQCPMLDGHASSRMLRRSAGIGAIARLLRAALTDKVRAAFGLSAFYVPLVARPGERAAMVSPDAYDGMQAITPPGWRNEIAARIFLSMPLYRPLRHAGDVKCPALFIACERDNLVSVKATFKAARRMGDTARIVTLPIGHFDIYLGEWFERASTEQVAFFKEALGGLTLSCLAPASLEAPGL